MLMMNIFHFMCDTEKLYIPTYNMWNVICVCVSRLVVSRVRDVFPVVYTEKNSLRVHALRILLPAASSTQSLPRANVYFMHVIMRSSSAVYIWVSKDTAYATHSRMIIIFSNTSTFIYISIKEGIRLCGGGGGGGALSTSKYTFNVCVCAWYIEIYDQHICICARYNEWMLAHIFIDIFGLCCVRVHKLSTHVVHPQYMRCPPP